MKEVSSNLELSHPSAGSNMRTVLEFHFHHNIPDIKEIDRYIDR